MKKVLALVVALGAAAAMRRKKSQESSDVWRNATRPN
ncbi:hypothetical protein BH10ACT8_BH10ACT8_24170 [soil metagenome]|jgi:hypothetical protein